jgi:hypothetical protein
LPQMSTGICTGICTLLPLRIGMLPLPTMLPVTGLFYANAGPPHDGERGGGHGEHSGDTGLDLHVLLLSSMIEFPGRPAYGRPGIHTRNVAKFNHVMQ